MESSDHIFISKLENRVNDVLVSFDGSNPQCMAKLKESIHVQNEESRNMGNSTNSRCRAHPKVHLPFYRNTRSKKATPRKDTQMKTNESMNESSTQETDRQSRIPYKFKRQFKTHLKGRIDGNCTLNPHSKNNKFIFINNLDLLEDTPAKQEITKKDLLSNFSNSCFSPEPSHRRIESRLDDKSSLKVIESIKKNVQKFLIPSVDIERQRFVPTSIIKHNKVAYNNPRYPSFSVPKQRNGAISSDPSFKKTKLDLSRFKGKIRVNTRLQLQEDPDFIDPNVNRCKNNYSVVCTPTVALTSQGILRNDSETKNRTIESREKSVNSATFKLPQLSTRSKRRAKYSTSSARKKLPKCFLMEDDDFESSRKSINLSSKRKSKEESRSKKRKLAQLRISNLADYDTERLLKAQICKKEWNDSLRFGPTGPNCF
ncbi:unnamed protein product [Moneuplotes crassus]|uniref:Uncharacterized protein n=1 Tax=Euplotes crassus TaxID=5936 RepID=A0AAD1X655_EUPCR|nr:unnamed protein product [Moneuplotes crassus]